MWEQGQFPRCGKNSKVAGTRKNLSPLQASTLLLRNTLVILKGEP